MLFPAFFQRIIPFFLLIGYGLLNPLYCQYGFKEGYLINNEGDTIYGLLNNMGSYNNNRLCVFKYTDEGEEITYKPFDIHSYRFIDGKYFISRNIYIKGEQKGVFLEYIINGKAKIYYYYDNKDKYFIEVDDDTIVELKQYDRIFLNEETGMENKKEHKEYIGILKYTLKDCPPVYDIIDNSELQHKSLIKVASEYHMHMCTDEECIVYEKKTHIKPIKLNGIFLGINNSYVMELNSMLKAEGKSNGLFPLFGYHYYVSLTRSQNDLYFNYKAVFSYEQHEIDYSNISSALYKYEYSYIVFKNNFGLSYITYDKRNYGPVFTISYCITMHPVFKTRNYYHDVLQNTSSEIKSSSGLAFSGGVFIKFGRRTMILEGEYGFYPHSAFYSINTVSFNLIYLWRNREK